MYPWMSELSRLLGLVPSHLEDCSPDLSLLALHNFITLLPQWSQGCTLSVSQICYHRQIHLANWFALAHTGGGLPVRVSTVICSVGVAGKEALAKSFHHISRIHLREVNIAGIARRLHRCAKIITFLKPCSPRIRNPGTVRKD